MFDIDNAEWIRQKKKKTPTKYEMKKHALTQMHEFSMPILSLYTHSHVNRICEEQKRKDLLLLCCHAANQLLAKHNFIYRNAVANKYNGSRVLWHAANICDRESPFEHSWHLLDLCVRGRIAVNLEKSGFHRFFFYLFRLNKKKMNKKKAVHLCRRTATQMHIHLPNWRHYNFTNATIQLNDFPNDHNMKCDFIYLCGMEITAIWPDIMCEARMKIDRPNS